MTTNEGTARAEPTSLEKLTRNPGEQSHTVLVARTEKYGHVRSSSLSPCNVHASAAIPLQLKYPG